MSAPTQTAMIIKEYARFHIHGQIDAVCDDDLAKDLKDRWDKGEDMEEELLDDYSIYTWDRLMSLAGGYEILPHHGEAIEWFNDAKAEGQNWLPYVTVPETGETILWSGNLQALAIETR